jgi:hypothetical protein
MNKMIYFCIFIIVSHLESNAQDTIFHKVNKEYEVTVLKKGYHHLYTAKFEGRTDSVWQWDYGGYEGIKILDIIIFDGYHISINSTSYDTGYSVYEYKNKEWKPLIGGTLFFFNEKYYLVQEAKAEKNKLEIKCNGNIFIYKINFEKKTIEKEGG